MCLVILLFALLANGEWLQQSRVPGDQELHFTIALKQQNVDLLQKRFWEVSDPDSQHYGDYWSVTQIAQLMAPPNDTVTQVIQLVKAAGGRHKGMCLTRDILKVSIPASGAERLFGTKLFWYHYQGLIVARASNAGTKSCTFALHPLLSSSVDVIPELCHFPMEHTKPQVVASGIKDYPPYDDPMQPTMLRALYQIPTDLIGDDLPQHGQSVMTSGNYNPEDLHWFVGNYTPSAAHQDVQQFVNYSNDPSRPSLETTVDVEYMIAMAPNVYTFMWGLQGNPTDGEMWLDIAYSFFSYTDPPLVWSVSYSSGPEYNVPYMDIYERMNIEFQKMGVAGGTILFGSTDFGAGCDPVRNTFAPRIPGSSPYITSVGGSKTLHNGTLRTYAGSGGGFSTLFPRPSYQDVAVASYLNKTTLLPPVDLYNPDGRAFPDVSVEGQYIELILNGTRLTLSGTSTSTPLLAGIISLLNAVRFSKSLPAVGFLNPLLYKLKTDVPGAFIDTCVDWESYQDCQSVVRGTCKFANWTGGWYATSGWNPVTGLGNPLFPKLAEASITYPRKFRAAKP
eukprot:TRINITY_DN15630_c1_g1_i3.p1 TRINITY_DN15630_c1_g1~~TRINITY_DN15630_c1_g1_i3.p1  ORF type:complete len:563 (-),score=66.27 TRINITY_DN15630_c1_g1_i3:1867-3555(-)